MYSCGWELDAREKAAIRLVPEQAWQIAIDHRGEVRERRADDACSNLAAVTAPAGSRKRTSPS